MISNKIKVLVTASVICSAYLFAGSISGSPHDLSGNTAVLGGVAAADNGEICVYCHTPHAANTAFAGAPLWNKATPSGTFTMYGTTIAGTTGDATPASPSLACLSCHDGASAIDSIVNAPGSGMGAFSAGTKNIVNGVTTTYGGNIGGAPGVATVGNPNLANDHPVSIVYTEGRAGLRATTTVLADITTTTWVGATTIANLLRSTKVECGSCHDPHNGGNTQGTSTEVNFLRHSNTASKLCLGCHNK
ncbi:cytochrome c3 family protein [Sulfurimonas sp.]|uniref:cytochrome c3 family protein n=1 Tax=Sulfurimonas sp. TaxID=2022749 RepID=UPI00286E7A73|nr:cytochrome c3 family protein [Sulfurimonas sp.]